MIGFEVDNTKNGIESVAGAPMKFGPGTFNSALNYYHYDSEFKAYETQAVLKTIPLVPGPRGYGALERFLTTDPVYKKTNNILGFDPSVYPQR